MLLICHLSSVLLVSLFDGIWRLLLSCPNAMLYAPCVFVSLTSAVCEFPGGLVGRRGSGLFDADAMRRFPIAKEGLTYIVALAVLWVVFALLGWTFLSSLTIILILFVINFFRDPERVIPQVPHAVLAPADGRIIFAGKTFENRFLNSEALKISIFMSIFNVHVNRVPFSGEVERVHYGKGTFLSANLDKASLNNEHNAVVLRTPEGKKIVFVQIAGLVARRIDCWLKPGDRVQRGERFGMIRFGSRLDVFVPADSRLAISEGHQVKAGESILCYHPRSDKNGGGASREG